MDDLNIIRKRCDILLAAANNCGDKKRFDELKKIKKFLENDKCFMETDEFTVTYTLADLGYTLEQANDIYEYFNRVGILPGLLEYTDNEGNVIQIEAMLSPDVEDYYKFDNGNIFKFDNKKQKFYSLNNGKWVYDAELQRKFYDSGYNYERISYKITKKDSPRR